MRLPLTAAQAGIWYGQQLEPASPAYNTADLVEIRGPFDRAAFLAALRGAIAEAEGLRARYGSGDDEPFQVIEDCPEWTVHEATTSVSEARAWCAADLATAADLGRGPVFGQALFRVGPGHHLWYQRIHHIAIDGFGTALLMRRVAELYNGSTGAGFAPLAPMIDEDRRYAVSERAHAAGAFWREYLDGAPEPVTPGRGAAAVAHTARRSVGELPAPVVAAVRAAGTRTATEALIAASAGWLHRLTGAPEVVLALPVMGRLGTPALRVPATVMNIVPLRVAIRPHDPFAAVVERVSDELRRCRPHHRYRHERLRRDRRLVGTGSARLFGPVVNVLPFAVDLRFGAATATVHNLSAGPVEDLSIALRELPGGAFRLELDGHPAVYDDAELAGHRDSFLSTVERLATDPARVSTPAADGTLAGPALSAVPAVLAEIRARVADRPDAIAVEGGLTYAGLWRNATALAGRIAAAGAGPGSLVAIALPRGADAVTAILGTMLAGAAYLPLDPRAPRVGTADLLADARPGLLVTDSPGTWGPPVLLVDDAAAHDAGNGAGADPGDGDPGDGDVVGAHPVPGRPVADEELAYVIYTSGSTGRPKGVAVSRGALAHFVAGARTVYGLCPGDRVLQFAPLHFDASVEELFGTLCAGATLVVRGGDPVEAPAEFLRWCAGCRITVLDLPTAYWHELVQAVHAGTAALPPTLRGVIIGGEAAMPERVAQWRAAVPSRVALWNTYGPTEATVVATVATL